MTEFCSFPTLDYEPFSIAPIRYDSTQELMMTSEKQLVTEISVTIRDESCSLTEKGLYYGPLEIHQASPEICAMIAEGLSKFKNHVDGEGPDIILKTKTVWQ